MVQTGKQRFEGWGCFLHPCEKDGMPVIYNSNPRFADVACDRDITPDDGIKENGCLPELNHFVRTA